MAISAQEVKQLRDRTGAGMMDCKRALEETGGDIDAAVEYLEKKGIAAAKKKAARVAAEGLVQDWLSEDATEAVLVEVNCETDFVARNDQFHDFVAKVTESIGKSDADSASQLDEIKVVGTNKSVSEYTTQEIATIGENINVRRFERFRADNGLVGSYIHAGGQIGVLVQVGVGDDGSREEADEFARDVAMHIAAMNPPYLSPDEIPADQIESQSEIFAAQMREEGKPDKIIPKIVEGKINKWKSEASLLEQSFVKDSDKTVREYQESIGGITLERFVRYQVGEGIEKEETDLRKEVAEQLQG